MDETKLFGGQQEAIAQAHGAFYALCQAVFYLIAFRHREILAKRKGIQNVFSFFKSNIGSQIFMSHAWTEDGKNFRELLACPLVPLVPSSPPPPPPPLIPPFLLLN